MSKRTMPQVRVVVPLLSLRLDVALEPFEREALRLEAVWRCGVVRTLNTSLWISRAGLPTSPTQLTSVSRQLHRLAGSRSHV